MTAATSAAAQSALLASAQAGRRAPKRVLPGFGLTLGYTLFYLSIIVLIPLSALIFKTFTLTWEQFWAAISSPRVVASYQLTFGASFFSALVNLVFGLLIALVGCHWGLRVKPNTQSLGAGTTASVVTSITMVIVVDALFAIVFKNVGI